jgi:hypothetical protein
VAPRFLEFRFAAFAAGAVLAAAPFAAKGEGDDPAFTASWLLFGDAYHVPSHHLPAGDGASGLVVRRGYLTFDRAFGDTWYARARFEANQSGEFEAYDFEVDFKDLYLGRRIGAHRFQIGLTPTPTFDVIESNWGARYLARTPMDLQGEASRDTGISLGGPLNRSGSLRYRAMLGAGADFGTDSNIEERKVMAAVSWTPAPGWIVDLYWDQERLAGPTDRRTVQGFVGYRRDGFRWGAQYSKQDRQEDPPLELASLFVARDVNRSTGLIARVDRLIEPSPKGNDITYLPMDPSAPATLSIGAVEFRLNDTVRITPNVVFIRYDERDDETRPENDLHLRLTLFLDFE